MFRICLVVQNQKYHNIHVHGRYAILKVYEDIAIIMPRSIWDNGDTIPVSVEGKVRDQVQSTATLIRLSRKYRG